MEAAVLERGRKQCERGDRDTQQGDRKMAVLEEYYDIVVVGAGHAGCEAALACARLGLETIMFTVSVDSIAQSVQFTDQMTL